MVTAATYGKEHHFRSSERLEVLHRGLLTVARDCGWQLEAWAVFSNHYHFIGHSPRDADSAESLSRMLGRLHTKTAAWLNRLDATPGRQVWHNFWESRLTYHRSYLARLNYVHQNPVKHGLVRSAQDYPWCSAGWFERTAPRSRVKTLFAFPTDRITIRDDYEPLWSAAR